MFESQYNDEMEAEVRRLEEKNRAMTAGHPDWNNACAVCGCELTDVFNKSPCRRRRSMLRLWRPLERSMPK